MDSDNTKSDVLDDVEILADGDDLQFTAEAGDADVRLDRFVTERLPDVSRAQVQRLIEAGQVQVNGKIVRASYKAQAGDLVAVAGELATVPSDIVAEDIPLEIVYEDADLLVVNKPKGMVVHPAPGSYSGTLVNALLYHCRGNLSGIGGVERPGIVHRLDKDTSGLLVVAKNDLAHVYLQKQIQARTATRKYVAYVWGGPRWEKAVIDAPLGRHPIDRKRMAVIRKDDKHAHSREAVTHVFVAERLGAMTKLDCALETGRTHQIRLHCEFAGHPVVGDESYGGLRRSGVRALDNAVALLTGQALHAFELSFDHPRTGERLCFTTLPPLELQELETVARNVAASSSR